MPLVNHRKNNTGCFIFLSLQLSTVPSILNYFIFCSESVSLHVINGFAVVWDREQVMHHHNIDFDLENRAYSDLSGVLTLPVLCLLHPGNSTECHRANWKKLILSTIATNIYSCKTMDAMRC